MSTRERIAWIIHEVASINDDEAADSFNNMGEVWYGVLMEAAEKIEALRATPSPEREADMPPDALEYLQERDRVVSEIREKLTTEEVGAADASLLLEYAQHAWPEWVVRRTIEHRTPSPPAPEEDPSGEPWGEVLAVTFECGCRTQSSVLALTRGRVTCATHGDRIEALSRLRSSPAPATRSPNLTARDLIAGEVHVIAQEDRAYEVADHALTSLRQHGFSIVRAAPATEGERRARDEAESTWGAWGRGLREIHEAGSIEDTRRALDLPLAVLTGMVRTLSQRTEVRTITLLEEVHRRADLTDAALTNTPCVPAPTEGATEGEKRAGATSIRDLCMGRDDEGAPCCLRAGHDGPCHIVAAEPAPTDTGEG